MRLPVLTGLLLLAASSLAAQAPTPVRGLGISVELARWQLDAGTGTNAATARWGPTVRLLLTPARHPRTELSVAVSVVPEGSFAPGLVGLAAGADWRLGPARGLTPGLDLVLGTELGALYMLADNQQAELDACSADPFCMFEGVAHQSGLRLSIGGGPGVDIRVGSGLRVLSRAHLLVGGGSGDAALMLRWNTGLGWQF
jgi:hypothetical protein